MPASNDGRGVREEQFTRDECWVSRCGEAPDGWIHGGSGSFAVCQGHGEEFEENGHWTKYEPADDGLRADGGSEQSRGPRDARIQKLEERNADKTAAIKAALDELRNSTKHPSERMRRAREHLAPYARDGDDDLRADGGAEMDGHEYMNQLRDPENFEFMESRTGDQIHIVGTGLPPSILVMGGQSSGRYDEDDEKALCGLVSDFEPAEELPEDVPDVLDRVCTRCNRQARYIRNKGKFDEVPL